jgi:signal transduction histidine kinase
MKHLFTGYTTGKSQDHDLQCRTITFIAAMSAPTTAVFSILNFLNGHIELAVAEVFGTLFFAYCFHVANKNIPLKFKRKLLLLASIFVLFAIFMDGGIAYVGLSWSYLIPFLAALLMGLPRAWYWILGYAGMLSIPITAHILGFHTLPYTETDLMYFAAMYTLSSLFAATFEAQFERLHVRYEKNIVDLEALKSNLEENVEMRTVALQKANEKLQHEILNHKETSLELKDSEHRFYQAQKMETIGTLVGGIAHDFNNMLAGINANLFMIKRKAKANPEIISRSEDVEHLVMGASDMIRQLLTFARQDRVQLQSFDLVPFLDEAFKLANVSISKTIDLTLENEAGSLLIHGNETQIQQVLMNMINNARDALKTIEKPTITVKMTSYLPSERFKALNPDMTADEYAKITVIDNGKGIPPEEVGKIFEPFFTTKEVGKGTGLGLSMCYGAIQSHAGTITVQSKVGHGTGFQIYIPVCHNEALNQSLTASGTLTIGVGQTILLADDNKQLRDSQKEVLQMLGYKILEAENGKEAISLFKEHQASIALTLMDITMPIMGGVAAVEEIRAIQPDARIIYVTGYDRDSTLNGERLPDSSDFILEKPYTMSKLNTVIQQQLQTIS